MSLSTSWDPRADRIPSAPDANDSLANVFHVEFRPRRAFDGARQRVLRPQMRINTLANERNPLADEESLLFILAHLSQNVLQARCPRHRGRPPRW